MADDATKIIRDIEKAQAEIAQKCYPAFDEQLMFVLERKHLDLPVFADILISEGQNDSVKNIKDHVIKNVRLMKIEEISFDSKEVEIHLPSVESALTSMRGTGYSLIFLVKGDTISTNVYLGVSKNNGDAVDIQSVFESYEAAWKANFPGSKFTDLNLNDICDISLDIAEYKDFGVLTGIPSLKRDEDSHLFVQGLERLIRAMRGKKYCWISIADPIPQEAIREAIDRCQSLQAEIHHHIKTDLSKATSQGKTIMLGMFGMLGEGENHGVSDADSTVKTTGSSESTTHSGGIIVYTYSKTKTTMESLAKGFTHTVSNAVSKQLGLGGFSSFGMNWTKTTTVGEELLNRKAEYVEETLKSYEERLQQGTALGMWNLGHYFCAENANTYNQGKGLVTSLFSGMDSTFEPPRAIKMPESFKSILRQFKNLYLHFETIHKNGEKTLTDHPLGCAFNGPGTPVNTSELAIATPIATQDVEGMTVTERASYGVNIACSTLNEKSLTIGNILDRGNDTRQSFKLTLANLPKHVAVFGLTGSGKTNTVHNMLTQLWKVHHIPFLVIEPAKAEYRALTQLEELKDDLLVISAGIDQSSACPLRLNPFDFDPGADNDANRVHILTHIDRLKATFNASFPMYASMPYILEEAILEIYRERGWDLGRSINRNVDIYSEDFSAYIPTLLDLYLKVENIVNRKGYYQEQQMNIKAALKARLSSLMVGAKGSMLNCLKSVPAKDLFTHPVVIELENMGDDDEKAFLMGLIVSRLYEYRKATFNASEKDSEGTLLKHVLVIEEAHRLLANIPDTSSNMEVANVKGKSVAAFVDMLSEIRAMGQSVFIVDQLPSRVSPNIVKGTGSKIIHRLLAKDDREAVGWTMGMNEEQINDLCMLQTGECVVSQDGNRKPYMCKVKRNELHENRTGGEISSCTKNYKQKHADLFTLVSEQIDMEDIFFEEELDRIMLAVGLGYSSAPLLASIAPTRDRKLSPEILKSMLSVYWKDLMHKVWGYCPGDFGAYVNLIIAGENVVEGIEGADNKFQNAFEAYYKETKLYLYIVGQNYKHAVFERIFDCRGVFSAIKNHLSSNKSQDRRKDLDMAINHVLTMIIPKGLQNNDGYKELVKNEIISRIPLTFSNKERNHAN